MNALSPLAQTRAQKWPAAPGTYALLLEAKEYVNLTAGRLGLLRLHPGRYVYVGSAQGPGGLRARLERHHRRDKPLHWHVDSLTALLPIVGTVIAAKRDRWECVWVHRLLSMPGISVPVLGFGSSDCREGCPAHLLRLPDHAGIAELEAFLQP